MMKSIFKITSALCLTAVLFSCESTKLESEKKSTPAPVRELKVINSQNESALKEETPTPVQLYKQQIEGISLVKVSAPKETSVAKQFSAPYVIKAEKSGAAVPQLQIAVSYPDSRSENEIIWGLELLTTGDDGTVSFLPPISKNSFNSDIKFYPAGDITNPEIEKLALQASLSIPYKVKTNKQNSGGTIAIVDFAQNGKPITSNSVSSSALLMALMRHGFTRIGNADFTNAILKDDSEQVYKVAKSLLGNNSAFLVYGTVKYEQIVTKNDDGTYSCSLIGNISCLNMQDGKLLYSTEEKISVTENKEWDCLPKARNELAEKLSQDILYGL